MFIGREEELKTLEEKIHSQAFEFGIIYGRRRIGKTSLLQEVIKRYGGIYFVATEMDLAYNIAQLSKTVTQYFNDSYTFSNLEDIFSYLVGKSVAKRITLVLDEFTYLYAKEPGIQSILQKIIDQQLLNSGITLLLSGSQVGLIEESLSYHKPLFGRATFTMQLKGFDYYDAAKFYPAYSYEDRIRMYSIFGGIPYYLSRIHDKKSIKENIIDLIIDKNAPFIEEVDHFLRQELRAISSYSAILYAISKGSTRLGEIDTKAKINNTGNTSKFLATLMKLDIVEKEICFGEKENGKKTLYRIKDNFFNFYYTFMFERKNALVSVNPQTFYQIHIDGQLDQFVGHIFEKVTMEYLLRENQKNSLNPFHLIGRFWGNHQVLKREVEIDVVTESHDGISVYECKWTNDVFHLKEADDLMEESSFLNPKRWVGVSKSGFTDSAISKLSDTIGLSKMFE